MKKKYIGKAFAEGDISEVIEICKDFIENNPKC